MVVPSIISYFIYILAACEDDPFKQTVEEVRSSVTRCSSFTDTGM
jgi:hypothetical protein